MTKRDQYMHRLHESYAGSPKSPDYYQIFKHAVKVKDKAFDGRHEETPDQQDYEKRASVENRLYKRLMDLLEFSPSSHIAVPVSKRSSCTSHGFLLLFQIPNSAGYAS